MNRALYWFWVVINRTFGVIAYLTGAVADFANERAHGKKPTPKAPDTPKT